MKVIISPAKKMKVEEDIPSLGKPLFLDKTSQILDSMKSLTYEELKSLWKCNDSIAQLNYERIQHMNLYGDLSPAVLAYEGIQYQYMAPGVMENEQLSWLQNHLRILSGFYGILKPMDGIVSYRLEMQTKLQVNQSKDLYDYWKDDLYQELVKEDHVILNLASKEYSKCIEKYLTEADTFVTISFMEDVNGKLVQKGTLAKMARGEMVRYLAENQIDQIEEVKKFTGLGFVYSKAHSNESEYVYIKNL